MAEPKKDEEGKEGEEAAKPKSKKKLIIIVAVVLLLVGIGVPLFLMGGEDAKKAEHGEEDEKPVHYETAKLDTFIVNLSENATFLKTTILVEYDPSLINLGGADGAAAEGGGHAGGGDKPAAGGLPPIFEKRKPMVHDAVIRILSSKKASEVLTAEGKETLKQELIDAINEALGVEEAPVVNVYFTEFIIQ